MRSEVAKKIYPGDFLRAQLKRDPKTFNELPFLYSQYYETPKVPHKLIRNVRSQWIKELMEGESSLAARFGTRLVISSLHPNRIN